MKKNYKIDTAFYIIFSSYRERISLHKKNGLCCKKYDNLLTSHFCVIAV
jgi:hypothetical protein